jgi:hypothetical protein
MRPTTLDASGPSGTTTTGASFAFSSNETGSKFECSLDGAPFYGRRQASDGARDHLQLERAGRFSAMGWEQGPSGPRYFHETLLRRFTCRDHPGRRERGGRTRLQTKTTASCIAPLAYTPVNPDEQPNGG